MRRLMNMLQDTRGATAVEYGLILSLIFLAMVGAVRGLATQTASTWDNVSNAVTKN